MKKLAIYTILTALSLTFVFNANAQETKKSNDAKHRIYIKVDQENKVILRADLLKGQKRLNYILNVSDESGENVYHAYYTRKKPVYVSFDLSKLPQGKYTFKVSHKIKPIYTKTVLNKAVESTQPEQLLVEEL